MSNICLWPFRNGVSTAWFVHQREVTCSFSAMVLGMAIWISRSTTLVQTELNKNNDISIGLQKTSIGRALVQRHACGLESSLPKVVNISVSWAAITFAQGTLGYTGIWSSIQANPSQDSAWLFQYLFWQFVIGCYSPIALHESGLEFPPNSAASESVSSRLKLQLRLYLQNSTNYQMSIFKIKSSIWNTKISCPQTL